jgi:hypothetical protein
MYSKPPLPTSKPFFRCTARRPIRSSIASAAAASQSEHDFGSFDADGALIFFKIDYYDHDLTYHSPDPSGPSVN